MAEVDLQGRVALVTGAAGGIGGAIATALDRAGASVAAVDLDRDAVARVADELSHAWPFGCDLSDATACRDLVGRVVGTLGRVDILVNNAGLQHVAPVESMPLERWNHLLATMLTAPFILIQESLPGMVSQGWGRIVNVGSVHALVASPNKSAYVSAKHGLLGLTRTVALEAGPHGVTVNMICPAYVRTPLVDGQIADQARTLGIGEDEVVDQVMLTPAAIRRLIEPAEVAAYVEFLCSGAAGMITGTTQIIDGGWTAR
jgi:3-hydroxybutyrate dehydrogenase